MKRIPLINILLLTVTTLMSLACTRNNGDIGDWFGSWRIESIDIDGEPDPGYPSPCVIWKFQSAATEMLVPDFDNHTTIGYTASGTWHEKDGYLYIDFTYGLNTPPEITHLQPQATLKIIKLSRHTIELEYNPADDNKTYFYKLRKWG